MKYENDKQLINDAVQSLIANHLKLSGSDEGQPSKDLGHVKNKVIEAYADHVADAEYGGDFDALIADSKRTAWIREEASHLFRTASIKANAKWEAAMMLLDIEA